MIEILAGLIAGTITGNGMGGGTILILILSIVLGLDQHTAQATNLIFFIPTSLSAIIVNFKNKLINWKMVVPIMICGIIGAIIGASISLNTDVSNLRKYFGIFIGIIAIIEIFELIKEYKKR